MSSVADQGADLPNRNDNFTFLLIDSYSESSHVADQVVDLTPLEMVILDSYLRIPTLGAHICQTR